MLKRFEEETRKGESFAFETPLANRSYVHSIREWQNAGYQVTLWFLALSSVDVALLYDNSGTVPVLLDWGEKR